MSERVTWPVFKRIRRSWSRIPALSRVTSPYPWAYLARGIVSAMMITTHPRITTRTDRGHRPRIRPLRRISQLVELGSEAQGAAFHRLLGKWATRGVGISHVCEVPALRAGPGPRVTTGSGGGRAV